MSILKSNFRRSLPDGRSEPTRRPYTSVSTTLLATERFQQLSTAGKRVLLWVAARRGFGPTGERPLLLSAAAAAEAMPLGSRAFRAARQELVDAGFLVQVRPARWRSRSDRSRAAEWRWVHAKGNARLDAGDPRRSGYWRVGASRLDSIVRDTTPAAMEIVVRMAAVDRDKRGAPTGHPKVSVGDLQAMLPAMPPRTLRHALAELVEAGLLRRIAEADGVAGSVYGCAGALDDGIGGGRGRTSRRRKPRMVVNEDVLIAGVTEPHDRFSRSDRPEPDQLQPKTIKIPIRPSQDFVAAL